METMVGMVYGNGGSFNKHQELGIKVSTQIGILIGQLLFGWLADVVGRRKMYGFELIIGGLALLQLRNIFNAQNFTVTLATFVQALAGQGPAMSIVGMLVIFRFIMGIGIGADVCMRSPSYLEHYL